MSASANKKSAKPNKIQTAATGANAKDLEVEADVLFQRLYGKWYAFSVLDDDCLVTQVDEAEVNKRLTVKRPPRAS